jgi:hypothetical protein
MLPEIRRNRTSLLQSFVIAIILIGSAVTSEEPAIAQEPSPAQGQAGTQLQDSEKNEIVRRAALAYYSLKRDGLVEFHCQAEPDWDSMSKAMKPPPTDPEQLMPVVKQLHFQVAVGPDGGALVSHQFDAAPPNAQMAQRLQLMTGGVDKMLSGFFQSWAPFSYGSFFPTSGETFQMEEAGNLYRLTQKQGDTDSTIVLTHDFEVTEIMVTTPKFATTMHLHFTQGEKGYVLNDLEANYKVGTDEANITMKVEYQNVEGFTLPETLIARVTNQRMDVPVTLKFVAYKVTTRAGK